MPAADKYSDRSSFLDALFALMLKQAAKSFPIARSFSPQKLADALEIAYTMGGGGVGPKFEAVFGQDFPQLVRSCAVWMAREDYLIEWQSGERNIPNTYRLSERGARLMKCLPQCLESERPI